MTCKQIKMFEIKYDDIIYKNVKIQKIIICGRIISIWNGKSPQGNNLLYLRFRDST